MQQGRSFWKRMVITLEQGTEQWEQADVHQETRGTKGNLESSKEMLCGEKYEASSCRLKLQAWKVECRSVSQCLRKRTWLGAKKAGAHSQDLERGPKPRVRYPTVSFCFYQFLPTPRTGHDGVSLFDSPCFICENLERSVTCLENELPVCSIYCMTELSFLSLWRDKIIISCDLNVVRFFKRFWNVTRFRKMPAWLRH